MQMANKKSLSGGGATSNKRVEVPIRPGAPTTNVVSPRGTSQLGYSTGGKLRSAGGHTAENTSLSVFERKAPEQALGNQLATNVEGGGPGKGREVLRSGTQGVHGQ